MEIDLRSDTVTKPSKDMLKAMMSAKVGDDVFGEDPTVNELEAMAADMFGKDAALFCPSGTMSNQIAIKILSNPPCEIICDRLAHIYNYEVGGIAFNSLCSVRLINGDRGRITALDIKENINPDNFHFPPTVMVAIENTCNKGGGSIYDFEEIKKIKKVCDENGLKLHLDGARIFNAIVESNINTKELGKLFDTISICLSKGLGAPVGSLLLSNNENIKKARRIRKVLGGGMRQAGFLAAAGIYALKNNINRLKEDHRRAKIIGNFLKEMNYVENILPVETNIVVVKLKKNFNPQDFLNFLSKNNIKAVHFGGQNIRFVTHLDFDDLMLEKLLETLKRFS